MLLLLRVPGIFKEVFPLGGGDGQGVAAFVFGVALMAADPPEGDFVAPVHA